MAGSEKTRAGTSKRHDEWCVTKKDMAEYSLTATFVSEYFLRRSWTELLRHIQSGSLLAKTALPYVRRRKSNSSSKSNLSNDGSKSNKSKGMEAYYNGASTFLLKSN